MPAISPSPPIQVQYIIYTTNKAVADAWLVANPSGQVLQGPVNLANANGLTVNLTPTVIPDPSGCWVFYAYDGGPFFGGKVNFSKFVDGGIVDPNDLYTDPYNNWDPIAWVWSGAIFYAGTSTGAAPSATLLTARRFVQGFEMGTGNGTLGNNPGFAARAASRTADGQGFNTQFGTPNETAQTISPNAPASSPRNSWERFYIKPEVYPNQGEVCVWSCTDNAEGLRACFITMNTTGQLRFVNVGNGGQPGQTLGTSGSLVIGTWYKIDIMFGFRGAATLSSAVSMWVNGVAVMIASAATGGVGLNVLNALHAASQIGSVATFAVGGVTPTVYKYSIDDWVNMDIPVDTNGLDFKNGTHVRRLFVTGVNAAGAWTGDYRGLNTYAPNGGVINQWQTNSPSNRFMLTTDYPTIQLGAASVVISPWFKQYPGGVYTTSIQIDGGAVTSVTSINAGQALSYGANVHQLGAGLATPPAIGTLNAGYTKDAGGTTVILSGFFLCVEYIGIWGAEDLTPGSTVPAPAKVGLHNAPYPESAPVVSPTPGYGWALARNGTYVGNGVGQDVVVGVPFHWIWIRPLTGTQGAGYWWSSKTAYNKNLNGQVLGSVGFPTVLQGPTSFQVSGSDAPSNAAGVVYQWVAFADPTSRFLLNGAFAWRGSVAVSNNNLLQNASFTPEAVMFAQEDIFSNIGGMLYRGPGNLTDTANNFNGADTASVATTATGVIVSKININSNGPQTAFAAWRSVDGNGASGLIDIVSYTGDGITSRNIAVDLGGNSPMFAFGVAHTLLSYFRDPSHTGLNSSIVASNTVTTAIIGGGLNYVTVGADLNVLGRTYDLFVIAGCANAGGWAGVSCIPQGIPPTPPPLPPGPPIPPLIPPPGPTTPPTGPCMTCTTLTTAIVLLASRLQDTGNVHWTAAELTRYLVEAVRTWNALTGSVREQGSFNTVANTTFYELPDQLPTLRAYNVKDIDLITDIQYSLMEPPTPTGWTGTLQFALADLTRALSHRRDRFLYETGMIVRRFVETITGPPANGRLALDPSIMTVRRAAYIPASGAAYPLSRDDEWSLQSFRRQWPFQPSVPTALDPMVYSVGATPPLTIQVAPPLSATGMLDLLVISRAGVHGQTTPCLDPTGTPTYMGIPDDWTWVVKFGALAELLNQQGVTYDPQRAAYCESRWRQGLQMATASTTVITAEIQGQPIQVDGIANADQFSRAWQAALGAPTLGLLAGNNLMAFGPIPNGVYTVTLDVIRNAPIPVLGTDCLGAEAQILDAVLDYAQHLAMFKEGPDQLKTAMDLLERFFRVAGVSNAIDWASVMNRPAQQQQTLLDEIQTHRIIQLPPVPNQSGGSQ